jgi:cell division transport system ATP-binding protein
MILFSNVFKQFDDSFSLEDLSFSIDSGELVMITGPSGSGKTTLMRLLMKEYTPTTGDIFFDNISLSKIKPSQVHHHRRKIGVVFQDYKLLPELNVWENVALALSIINSKESEIERKVTDLLDLVSLSDKAFHFPAQLSGGEAQRVCIARALSTAPKVVFADEPTGNLDLNSSKNIISLLKKINDMGTTVMITTHDHDVHDWLDSVRHLALDNGKIISDSKEKSAKNRSSKTQHRVDSDETSDDTQKPQSHSDKVDSESSQADSDKVDSESSEIKSNHKKTQPETYKKSFWSKLGFFKNKSVVIKDISNNSAHQEKERTQKSEQPADQETQPKTEKVSAIIEDL